MVAAVKLVGKVLRSLPELFPFSSVTVATVVLNESTFVMVGNLYLFAAARSLRSVEIVVFLNHYFSFIRLSTVFFQGAVALVMISICLLKGRQGVRDAPEISLYGDDVFAYIWSLRDCDLAPTLVVVKNLLKILILVHAIGKCLSFKRRTGLCPGWREQHVNESSSWAFWSPEPLSVSLHRIAVRHTRPAGNWNYFSS